MQKFIQQMRVQKFSEITIGDRVEVLHRLGEHLPVPLLQATAAMLVGWQGTFAHLAPATIDIYTRHVKAFYGWCHEQGYLTEDPAARLPLPNLPKGKPHPTSHEDLRTILACARGSLLTAYVLAAFAGLRCGEICRLRGADVNRDHGKPVALIHGKGSKERTVPLLAPVVAQLGYDRGWVVTTMAGKPYSPGHLSAASSTFIHELGIQTTLHSMRHFFGTNTVRLTHDPLLVRDLLGHESLATTEIYMLSDLEEAHERLAPVADLATRLLGRALRATA